MIEPGSFASISRSATVCAMKKAARTLSAKMASKSSTVTSGSIGRPVHAGIVDQDLIGRARGQAPAHRVDVGDVEHQRIGLLPARADGGGGLLDFAFGARRERHMRASIGQRRRCRQPDAAPAAGHQRAAAVEAEGGGGR